MRAILKSDTYKELNIVIELDDNMPGHFYDKLDEVFDIKRTNRHNLFLRIQDKSASKSKDLFTKTLVVGRTYPLGYCYFIDNGYLNKFVFEDSVSIFWEEVDIGTVTIEE